MATNVDLTWHLSGGSGNTDPAASLGGGRATAVIHDVEGTVTSGAAVGDTEVFDSALGGNDGDHVGKFLLFTTGFPNVTNQQELNPTRVTSYRASDGRLGLAQPLVGAVASGSTYRLYESNAVFDDASPAECAAGDVEYRGIYVLNGSGQALNDLRFYFFLVGDSAGVEWAVSADDTPGATLGTIPDESTAPNLSAMDPNAGFSRPITFSMAEHDQPRSLFGFDVDLSAGAQLGLWLRRTVPANSRRRGRAHVVIAAQGDDGGTTVRAGCVLAFGLDGFTPQIGVARDRTVRVGGGARYVATVRAQETGLVVPELEMSWEKSLGPGTLSVEVDDLLTDEDGESTVAYEAPTDQGQAGQTVEVKAKV